MQDTLAIPRNGINHVLEPLPAVAPATEESVRGADDASSERMVGFDVLRITAIVAILWFHSGAPGSDYMVWRLPALTMISVSLATGSSARRSLGEQIRRSASRLLLPWLFWCSVYGFIDGLDYLRKGRSIALEMGPCVLLSGTSLHLWFLPFAFTMAVSLYTVRRMAGGLLRFSISPTARFGLAGIGISAIIASRELLGVPPSPFSQWLNSFPAVLLGLAIGTVIRRPERGAREILVAMIPALFACLILEYLYGDVALRYGLAMILVCLASTMAFSLPRRAGFIPKMAMGVYLVQGLTSRVLYVAFDRLPMVEPRTGIYAIAVILASFALVGLLWRTPVRRFV